MIEITYLCWIVFLFDMKSLNLLEMWYYGSRKRYNFRTNCLRCSYTAIYLFVKRIIALLQVIIFSCLFVISFKRRLIRIAWRLSKYALCWLAFLLGPAVLCVCICASLCASMGASSKVSDRSLSLSLNFSRLTRCWSLALRW